MDAVDLFHRVNGDDVGVIERGDGLRFSFKTRAKRFVVGQLGRQNLECDVAVECGIVRAIHFAHPAGAEGATISYGPRRVPADRGMRVGG